MEKTYQIRVQLEGVTKPPIWREMIVPADTNLYLLHCCLQGAMGWYNCHLHHFICQGKYYSIPSPHDDFEVKDSRKVSLSKLLTREKDALQYEYDFGDGWMHKITLEKIIEEKTNKELPKLVNGKGACPPEDCGGVWGYQNLKEAIADPKHEEHEDLIEWVGDDFDPNEFDLETHQDEMLSMYQEGVVNKGSEFNEG